MQFPGQMAIVKLLLSFKNSYENPAPTYMSDSSVEVRI